MNWRNTSNYDRLSLTFELNASSVLLNHNFCRQNKVGVMMFGQDFIVWPDSEKTKASSFATGLGWIARTWQPLPLPELRQRDTANMLFFPNIETNSATFVWQFSGASFYMPFFIELWLLVKLHVIDLFWPLIQNERSSTSLLPSKKKNRVPSLEVWVRCWMKWCNIYVSFICWRAQRCQKSTEIRDEASVNKNFQHSMPLLL